MSDVYAPVPRGIRRRRRPDWPVFGVVFLMLFAFSYSEQLLSGLFDLLGYRDRTQWWPALVVVDAAVLSVVGLMKVAITRADGDNPRLWGWWWTGFAILITIDVLHLFPSESFWIHLLQSSVYAATMGFVMAASLNADPLTLISSPRRIAYSTDWLRVRAIVPLVLGTWACYLAATAFVDLFDVETVRALDAAMASDVEAMPLAEQVTVLTQLCGTAVSPVFFAQVVNVMPLLLLTLGVEFNYFRRTLLDPAQRAATAAIVTVMAGGLIFALSTLPFDGEGCGDVLSSWHEYFTFVIAVQGIFTGLAALVWLLVSTPDDQDDVDDGYNDGIGE